MNHLIHFFSTASFYSWKLHLVLLCCTMLLTDTKPTHSSDQTQEDFTVTVAQEADALVREMPDDLQANMARKLMAVSRIC